MPEIVGEGSTELDIRDGLALIGPSIETHADTQYLIGRALAALQIGPMSTVAAIDEETALVIDVSSGRTKVVGRGKVTWVTADGDRLLVRFVAQPRSWRLRNCDSRALRQTRSNVAIYSYAYPRG